MSRKQPLTVSNCSIFEKYQNTGDGSNTSERVTETTATASVTKKQLWPDGYDWIDTTY